MTPEEEQIKQAQLAWDAYVNAYMKQNGTIDKGAIAGLDGSSIWTTQDPDWKITPEETVRLAQAYDNAATSFVIAGEKYMFVRREGRSIYLRKGKEGAIIVQTTQAMLIGHYPETVLVQNAAPTIESFADYFISINY